jgi:hypothetical protein
MAAPRITPLTSMSIGSEKVGIPLTCVAWMGSLKGPRRKTFLGGFQVPRLEHCRTTINADPKLREDFNAVVDFLGDELMSQKTMFAPMAGGGKRSVGAITTQKDNSNSGNNSGNNQAKGGGKRWHNAKKDREPPAKTGKLKGKKDKAATAFDPNDPGPHLTSKAWRALTEEQKTASRETRANQKQSVNVITRTLVSKVTMAPSVAAKAPPVATQAQVQDVEMVEAGVTKIIAGVASLGHGGLKPVSRKTVCVMINATQCIPTSHTVSYAVGTKSGSAKGIKAINEMKRCRLTAVVKTANELVVLQGTTLPKGTGFRWCPTVLWQEGNDSKTELLVLQPAGTTRKGRSLLQMAIQGWNWIHMRMRLCLAWIAALLMTRELCFLLMDLNL